MLRSLYKSLLDDDEMTRSEANLYKYLQKEHKNITVPQAIKKLCGNQIGAGTHRTVYEYKHNDGYVVKIDYSPELHNVIEYHIWDAICLADWWAKWFAPCIWISHSGRVLVMKRAEFKRSSDYPNRVPNFFTDLKRENFGWIDDQFVAIDYSFVLERLTGFMGKKMRNARWNK